MTLSRVSNKDDLNSQSKEIGGRSIRRSMILFLIPMILSNVLQSIGQLAGSIIVGRWLGVDALAAISAFFPLFFLLVSFTIGIGSGSSILIGQAYGARNEERLKAIVGTTLTFTFLLGLVLAILGAFLPGIFSALSGHLKILLRLPCIMRGSYSGPCPLCFCILYILLSCAGPVIPKRHFISSLLAQCLIWYCFRFWCSAGWVFPGWGFMEPLMQTSYLQF